MGEVSLGNGGFRTGICRVPKVVLPWQEKLGKLKRGRAQWDSSVEMTSEPSHHAEYLLEQSRWIRSLARRLVSPDDADDLVQDTLAAALVARSPLERPSRAWLATVARRIAMKRQRSDRHRTDRETLAVQERGDDGSQGWSQGGSQVPTPEELVARSEQQRAVVDAVLALDEPYRSTVLLRYFEGLEPKDIAERTGIPAATVRTRLRRGVETVRMRLDEASGGDRSQWMRALTPLAGLPIVFPPPSLSSTSSPTSPAVQLPEALPTAASPSLITSLLVMPSLLKFMLVASPLLLALTWFGQSSGLSVQLPPSFEGLAPELSLVEPAPLEAPAARIATDRVYFESLPETVESELAPSTDGVLTVIDRRTGQPAAHLKISPWHADDPNAILAGPDHGPLQVTDAKGQVALSTDVETVALRHHFDSTARLLGQLVQRSVPDDPEVIPIRWENGAAQVTVDVGYTVFVEFSPDFDGKNDVFAILSQESDLDLWHGQPSDVVQEGDRTYLRFERDVRGKKNRWIHFAMPNGLAAVSLPCDEYFDNGRVLPVKLEPYGVVAGTVRPMMGDPIAEANVVLLRGDVTEAALMAPDQQRMKRLRDLSDEADFPFSFGPLEPGEYTLFAGARGQKSFRRTVRVRGGETFQLPVELRWDGGATARIRGRIVSETGHFHGPLKVKAWEDSYVIPDSHLVSDVVWKQDGEQWTGSFLIENVAQKSYRLTVHAEDGLSNPIRLPEILPKEGRTAIPGEVIEIELTDGEPDHDLVVTAKDAVTGAPVQKFEAYAVNVETLRQDTRSGRTHEGSATIHGLLDARRYSLYVVAKGYRATHVSATVLDGKTALDVTMRPGWFRPLAIRDEEGQPIAGVEILCDGEGSFLSDAMGLAWCNLDEAPDRMTVQHPEWTVTETNFLDEAGRLKEEFRVEWDSMSVFMKRVEKR